MVNTWFWPSDDRTIKMFSRTMGNPPVQWMIKERNFFVTVPMKRILQVKPPDREFAHCTEVAPTHDSREGIAVFPKEVLTSHPWLGELEGRVAKTLRATVARWREDFPDANVAELVEAGRYIQEDDPNACVDAIREVLAAS